MARPAGFCYRSPGDLAETARWCRWGGNMHRTWPVLQSLVLPLAICAVAWATPLAIAPQPVHAQGDDDTTATRLLLFVPFGPNGLAAGIQVTGRETFQGNPAVAGGSCQAGSIRTSRPDAWRCGTADPCFADPAGHEPALACAVTPWSGRVVLLTVLAPLPMDLQNPFDPSTTPPWALELTDGTRCVAATGTVPVVETTPYAYTCESPSGLRYAARPDRSQALWTVRMLLSDGQTVVPAPTSVLAAWY